MSKEHIVGILPGTGDHDNLLKFATFHFRLYKLTPLVFHTGWEDKQENLDTKLARLLKRIDGLAKDGTHVSLIGISAGGWIALLLLKERPDVIQKIITIGTPMNSNVYPGSYTFAKIAQETPVGAQALKRCEKIIQELPVDQKRKILTVYAKADDPWVPPQRATIPGIRNIIVPVKGHVRSIAAALTIFQVACFLL